MPSVVETLESINKTTTKMTDIKLICGDNRDVLKDLPGNSIDAVVTDPPYFLSFMGRKWDTAPRPVESYKRHKQWATGIFRVLKPGGHALVFGGTRTFHRLTCALEDAGFEIRDCLSWMYGTGFPKSVNISKEIDRTLGYKREKKRITGNRIRNLKSVRGGRVKIEGGDRSYIQKGMERGYHEMDGDDPVSDEAKEWDGWGTGLKPSWEPIVLVRKPLKDTVAKNVLEYGTGGLNINDSRVGVEQRHNPLNIEKGKSVSFGSDDLSGGKDVIGRFPVNTVLSHHPECELVEMKEVIRNLRETRPKEDSSVFVSSSSGFDRGSKSLGTIQETVEDWRCVPGCPVKMLDEQSGESKSSQPVMTSTPGNDSGGASRFFYCAKADNKQHPFLCNTCNRVDNVHERHEKHDLVYHPTVKPIKLLEYLIRLITPPGGTVLDPFVGSGSTLVAAKRIGFDAVGIELEPDYIKIAEWRLSQTGTTLSNFLFNGDEE